MLIDKIDIYPVVCKQNTKRGHIIQCKSNHSTTDVKVLSLTVFCIIFRQIKNKIFSILIYIYSFSFSLPTFIPFLQSYEERDKGIKGVLINLRFKPY
jgi:hypothetical protein